MSDIRSCFPARPQFSGFMKPCRVEGDVSQLEVYGDIPKEIDGVFYRVMPDPQLPPFIENDPVRKHPTNTISLHIEETERDSGSTVTETSVPSASKTAVHHFGNATCELRSLYGSAKLNAPCSVSSTDQQRIDSKANRLAREVPKQIY